MPSCLRVFILSILRAVPRQLGKTCAHQRPVTTSPSQSIVPEGCTITGTRVGRANPLVSGQHPVLDATDAVLGRDKCSHCVSAAGKVVLPRTCRIMRATAQWRPREAIMPP